MRLSINENYITYHPQERRKHADTLKLIKVLSI